MPWWGWTLAFIGGVILVAGGVLWYLAAMFSDGDNPKEIERED